MKFSTYLHRRVFVMVCQGLFALPRCVVGRLHSVTVAIFYLVFLIKEAMSFEMVYILYSDMKYYALVHITKTHSQAPLHSLLKYITNISQYTVKQYLYTMSI